MGDAGPNLRDPWGGPAEVRKLSVFAPGVETGFLLEAIPRLAREVGPDVPALGFAAAPWTLACYMVEGRAAEGFPSTKTFRHGEATSFRELLHRIAKSTALYLEAQIAAGAAAVQLFDTWSGELNLRDYLDFALPATQEIVSSLARRAPVIYYTKASNHLLLAAADTGADVLSVDWRADLRDLRNTLGPRVALQGNVDPAVLFAPAETIRRGTRITGAAARGAGPIL